MKRAVILLTLAVMASAPTSASADEPVGPVAEQADAETPETASAPAAPKGTPLKLREAGGGRGDEAGGGFFAGAGWKLLAVFGVLGAALLWARKRQAGATAAPSGRPTILARTAIGVRTELLVVDVEGQRLLLGVTPTHVSTLSVLTVEDPAPADPDVERPMAKAREPEPSEATLGESLGRLIANARAEAPLAAPTVEHRERKPRVSSAGAPVGARKGPKTRELHAVEGQIRGLVAKRGGS